MKNFGRFFLIGAAAFIFAKAQDINPPQSDTGYTKLEEKISKINQKTKKATLNYYKLMRQFIPEENVKIYPCYSKNVSFDDETKKIKLSQAKYLEDYVSMVDPNSKEVMNALAYFRMKNKTTIEAAEDIFNALKYYKFQGIKYSYDKGQSPLELAELKMTDPDAYKTLKDIINHPDQTLKEKKGDCEDLAILYCSCLLAEGIKTALVTVNGHVFTLIKVKYSEFDIMNVSRFVIDWQFNGWVPIDISKINKIDFNKALEKGMTAFRNHHSDMKILIPEQNQHLFGY